MGHTRSGRYYLQQPRVVDRSEVASKGAASKGSEDHDESTRWDSYLGSLLRKARSSNTNGENKDEWSGITRISRGHRSHSAESLQIEMRRRRLSKNRDGGTSVSEKETDWL
jgi:hypothetical protein